MRFGKLVLCAGTLLGLAACSDDSGVTNGGPPPPAALVRFVNTVTDTGTVDLRFVDKVESLPTMQGIAFRGASGLYQRVEPGARNARVFPTSTNIDLTQIRLVDTTVTFVADNRYTLVYAGRANGNQDRLAVIADDLVLPTPPANNIAFQVLHAATGVANVDVYITPAGAANNPNPIANAVAVVRNLGFLGKSAYVNVPVRPTSGDNLYQFTVTAAGSTTPLFTARPNQPGALPPAGATYGPQPGVQINGSVMTAVLTSGSVAGTRQSTAATQTPNVVLLIDKVLNP
jgi:hypothetical protein